MKRILAIIIIMFVALNPILVSKEKEETRIPIAGEGLSLSPIICRVGFPAPVHRISIYGGDEERLVAYADSSVFTGKFQWTVIDTSETLKTLFKDLERRF